MNKKGFTLIELLTVIGIMAIVMAIASPALYQWRESAQVREVARDVLSGLRQARSQAITTNEPVVVTIETGIHTMLYDDVVVRHFADQIGVEGWIWGAPAEGEDSEWILKTELKNTFYPNGSCSDSIKVRVDQDDDLIVKIESTASGLAQMTTE